jgi:hypothetical protein
MSGGLGSLQARGLDREHRAINITRKKITLSFFKKQPFSFLYVTLFDKPILQKLQAKNAKHKRR